MTALVLATLAGLGCTLLVTAPPPNGRARPVGSPPPSLNDRAAVRLRQAGLDEVSPLQFVAATLTAAVIAGALAATMFGPTPVALAIAALAGTAPAAHWRRRRATNLTDAQEHWPRLLEEVRVQVGPMGRAIPQALLDVGHRAPPALRPAFAAAQREWNLRTDFERMLSTLKEHLDDASVDATCETLLIVHDVGGDVDSRLAALAEDRRQDLRDRRESDARQSGARFARWFVVAVPVGMAVAGANVGDGIASYRTSTAQVVVLGAITLVAACWWWAGSIMRLPDEQRVFTS